jgi:methanethiol S-methyltransferase
MTWLILAVLLWGFIHSLLATLWVKERMRRLLGPAAYRFYRLVYNLLAVISFIPVLGLAWLTEDKRLYTVPLPWSLLMGLGELLAMAALWAGFRQTSGLEFIGLSQLGSPDPEAPVTGLVTGGLYKVVRHPLYSAGLAFIWLFPVMTSNMLAIDIGLTVYVIIGAILEERKLVHAFGQAYRDYQAVTPMLIPFTKWNKRSE